MLKCPSDIGLVGLDHDHRITRQDGLIMLLVTVSILEKLQTVILPY